MNQNDRIRGTTVVAVKKDGRVAMAADGQVTAGDTVIKSGANKLRTLYDGNVLAGFAGRTADAITLFELFEEKLKDSSGNLLKAAISLAKEWRTDKRLRSLDALLLVADREHILLLSGGGDVISPDGDVMAIGSGGPYATAAATTLLKHTRMGPKKIAEEAIRIAASLCIYTNDNINVVEL